VRTSPFQSLTQNIFTTKPLLVTDWRPLCGSRWSDLALIAVNGSLYALQARSTTFKNTEARAPCLKKLGRIVGQAISPCASGTVSRIIHAPFSQVWQAIHLSRLQERLLRAPAASASWRFSTHRLSWHTVFREAMRRRRPCAMGGEAASSRLTRHLLSRLDASKAVSHSAPSSQLRGPTRTHSVICFMDLGVTSFSSRPLSGSPVNEVIPIVEANVAKERRDDRRGSALQASVSASSPPDPRRPQQRPRATRKAAHLHTQHGRGYFSVFKRGMRRHISACKMKHLHVSCGFDFRYNKPLSAQR